MNSIITLITNSTLFKWAYGYFLGISSVTFLEQKLTHNDYFMSLQNQVPSKIAMVLGIIYGIVILLGRISKEWKQHKLNMQEIKKGNETVEQAEIATEKQRKDL